MVARLDVLVDAMLHVMFADRGSRNVRFYCPIFCLVVFAVWTVHVEEVALFAAFHLFLEEEHQVLVLERLQPLIPTHLFQLLAAVAGKVEAQHAEMVAMLCSRHSRRYRLALLCPVLNHFGVLRCERLPWMILVLVRIVDPFGMQRRGRQLTDMLLQKLLFFRRKVCRRNLVMRLCPRSMSGMFRILCIFTHCPFAFLSLHKTSLHPSRDFSCDRYNAFHQRPLA